MTVKAPYALAAELTHRCPLHCVYCSNPVELQKKENELDTAEWLKVVEEASDLGVVQVHVTGGEPLLRSDAETIIQHARKRDLFVNLITSGVGLTEQRLVQLAAAGVDSIQLSIQSATADIGDRIAGFKAHELKRHTAKLIRNSGIPLHMNVVLHRHNIHMVEEIIDLCVSWGAERLELANTQYYGWALANREQLLPAKRQLIEAEKAFMRAKERYVKQIELLWILPDYYEEYPKPCMGGWGALSLTVTPDGRVLPCTAASSIKSLRFESVTEHDLAWIWRHSPSFNAYRGEEWMAEPCRSCDRRFLDYGGCRCQAFQLTGDAGQADPVCKWSPNHHLITQFVAQRNQSDARNEQDDASSRTLFSYRGM